LGTAQKTVEKEEKGEIFLVNGISPNMFMADELNIYMKKIDIAEARKIVQLRKPVSYIGHLGTAQALETLLGIHVPLNRSQLKIQSGEMLVFTLNKRLNEGEIITSVEEINKIGYSIWYILVRG